MGRKLARLIMAKRDKFVSLDTYFVLDPYVQTLNANDRWLYLVLMANPDISMIGIYEVGLPTLELYSGLGREAIGNSLDVFAKAGKVHYIDGWIILKNHIKNNPIKGSEKLVIGAHRRFADVPWHIKERIVAKNDVLYIPYFDENNTLYIGYAEGTQRVGTLTPALTPALTHTPPLKKAGVFEKNDRKEKHKNEKEQGDATWL
jgi:hypothetical protein